MVTIDNLWEDPSALSDGTIANRLQLTA